MIQSENLISKETITSQTPEQVLRITSIKAARQVEEQNAITREERLEMAIKELARRHKFTRYREVKEKQGKPWLSRIIRRLIASTVGRK